MATQDDKHKDSAGITPDIPLRTAEDEFKPDEMLQCRACNRSTPPNRLDCLYCGAEINTSGLQGKKLRPALRPPSSDEAGFDLVLTAGAQAPDEEYLRIVKTITRLEDSDLRKFFELNSAAPIARSGSKKSVELALSRLQETGIEAKMFDDEQFLPGTVPARVRGISVEDDGRLALIMFNNDKVEFLAPTDVILVVTGRITNNRFESKEKHKRNELKKVVSTTESADDEVFIDIYRKDTIASFRIQVTGFDFSFLAGDKDLLAAENIRKTVSFIRQFAKNAKFDDSYDRIRSSLDLVWPPEEHEDTRSIRRRAFGNFEKNRMIMSSSVGQFTKYSKLQWLVREN